MPSLDPLRVAEHIHGHLGWLATVGYLFERKEHLAFGCLLLAWAGAVAYLAASRRYVDVSRRDALRRAAHWAFVASANLGTGHGDVGDGRRHGSDLLNFGHRLF